MASNYLVFGTSNYDYFQDRLCKLDGFEMGALQRITFPDGEKYQRLSGPVRGRDVVVTGGTISEAETLELFDLACGLVQHGANTLTLVVPYFGYATMERAVKPGEIVTGKNRALLLSSIPRARICNEILMVDLHTGGIPHYFEGQLRPYHIYAKRLINEIVGKLRGDLPLVLASTDAGRAKWVEHLAYELAIPAAFVYKQRLSGNQTDVRGINAEVQDCHVVIYDDMIRTGGSLLNAAAAYRQAGAAKLTAITTHGVFPGNALANIQTTGLFERVYATDTHPRAVALAKACDDHYLELHSIIPDIANFLLERDEFSIEGFLNT